MTLKDMLIRYKAGEITQKELELFMRGLKIAEKSAKCVKSGSTHTHWGKQAADGQLFDSFNEETGKTESSWGRLTSESRLIRNGHYSKNGARAELDYQREQNRKAKKERYGQKWAHKKMRGGECVGKTFKSEK